MKRPCFIDSFHLGLVLGGILLVGAAVPFSPALAVPAAPIEHRLTQPDGQSFLARQWGDEWARGWETREGYAIIRDDRSREWVYARRGPSGNGPKTCSSTTV